MPARFELVSVNKLDFALSGAIACAMAAASVAGLVAPNAMYPSEELRLSFVSNDAVNLILGLPLLLTMMGLAYKGRLIGLLLWPGALLYVSYNYLAYAAALAMSWQFFLHLTVAILSIWAITRLLKRIDRAEVQRSLGNAVPARTGGAVLTAMGLLFFLRAGFTLVGALAGQQALLPSERGVLIADLLVTPLWVASGIMLWRKRSLGYASGPGVLFQASMLFAGLLIFFILRPFIAGGPFPTEDFVAILAMSLICFIPFAFFVLGIIKSPVKSPTHSDSRGSGAAEAHT